MKRIMLLFSAAIPVALLLTAMPATTWARNPQIYTPDPIQAPCSLSPERVRGAVRSGVLSRGWIPTDKGAGVIEAKLDKGKYVAVVTITYDSRSVRIRYKSSENLGYAAEGNSATIKSGYNGWIKNIERDIAINLSKACG